MAAPADKNLEASYSLLTMLSVVMLVSTAAQAANITGVPRVVDGDTLAIGMTKVRLEGIDARETDQICLNTNGVRWTCGIDARDQLAAHIKGRAISCAPNGTKRTLAKTLPTIQSFYGGSSFLCLSERNLFFS